MATQSNGDMGRGRAGLRPGDRILRGNEHTRAPAERAGSEFTVRRLHQQEERETEAGDEGRLLCEPMLHLERQGEQLENRRLSRPCGTGSGAEQQGLVQLHTALSDPGKRVQGGLETGEAEETGGILTEAGDSSPC